MSSHTLFTPFNPYLSTPPIQGPGLLLLWSVLGLSSGLSIHQRPQTLPLSSKLFWYFWLIALAHQMTQRIQYKALDDFGEGCVIWSKMDPSQPLDPHTAICMDVLRSVDASDRIVQMGIVMKAWVWAQTRSRARVLGTMKTDGAWLGGSYEATTPQKFYFATVGYWGFSNLLGVFLLWQGAPLFTSPYSVLVEGKTWWVYTTLNGSLCYVLAYGLGVLADKCVKAAISRPGLFPRGELWMRFLVPLLPPGVWACCALFFGYTRLHVSSISIWRLDQLVALIVGSWVFGVTMYRHCLDCWRQVERNRRMEKERTPKAQGSSI